MAPTTTRKILIVDDSEGQLLALRQELATTDIEVIEARSGIAALRSITLARPDLVTLDIELPDINGYRVLQHLRRQESTMSVPIIMISGNADDDERLRALEGGAIEYFVKPFPPGHLRRLVQGLLEQIARNSQSVVCCVSDDPILRNEVLGRLTVQGYPCKLLSSKEDVIDMLRREPCAVLLLDLHLANHASYGILDHIQRHREEIETGVIGLTWSGTRADLVHAFHLGIDDFVRVPFFGEELLARVERVHRSRERVVEFRRLAVVDPLTKLPNRADLARRLPGEVARTVRAREALGLLMIDIDHFKRLNDTYGHSFGDQVLTATAQAMRDQLRSSDMLVRYGGEEFVLIAGGTPQPGLAVVAERVRRSVESLRVVHEGTVVPVTVSVGGCVWNHSELTADHPFEPLIEPADAALYRAKRDGRNCSRFANETNASRPVGVIGQ